MRVLSNLLYPVNLSHGSGYVPVVLDVAHYDNGRIALELMSEIDGEPGEYEPFTTLTVNLVDEDCPLGEAWIKNYAENEGAVEWMLLNELIEEGPTDNCQSGHAFIERFKLSHKLMEAIGDALVAQGERSRR